MRMDFTAATSTWEGKEENAVVVVEVQGTGPAAAAAAASTASSSGTGAGTSTAPPTESGGFEPGAEVPGLEDHLQIAARPVYSRLAVLGRSTRAYY